MRTLRLLETGGYALALRIVGGVAIVEARRSPATTLPKEMAAPLLLTLMRNQGDAMQYLAGTLLRRIVAGPDDEIDIAAYQVCIGTPTTSDGEAWVDVLQLYIARRDAAAQ